MKDKIILLFFTLYISTESNAQLSLNIEQAIETGVKNNYAVRLSKMDMEK